LPAAAETDSSVESRPVADDFAASEPAEAAEIAVREAHPEVAHVEEARPDPEARTEPAALSRDIPKSGPKTSVAPIEEESSEEDAKLDWYILKVQSNREETARDALQRRVKMLALEKYVQEIIVPSEKVTEFTASGKKRTVKRKLYPGYLVVHMAINDETWFLVRETPGIGDFTSSGGKPSAMQPHEVEKLLAKEMPDQPRKPSFRISLQANDKVKVIDGTFADREGEISAVDEHNGKVTVMITIFNRLIPVELDHWQLEKL